VLYSFDPVAEHSCCFDPDVSSSDAKNNVNVVVNAMLTSWRIADLNYRRLAPSPATSLQKWSRTVMLMTQTSCHLGAK